ncbi:hypothetical protein [Pseudomonas umsongensis]|jgi:hypothetical protein|uniref:hypothetical protein n=1 Tax=Pseudomonas umsongensis TaxID=198618 RepID=UPI0015BF73F1|nr:hypothetical protein [Pseudomonas umsongensis]NWL18834.1 hypothetical protein [Pseudomonas umsongensis]
MMSPQFATVRLFFNNAGIEFDLPLEIDGTMPPWAEHFRSVESLINLMRTVARRPLQGDEAGAFGWLTEVFLYHPDGGKLLIAMRGFIRSQEQAEVRWEAAYGALFAASDGPPMDANEKYGTPGRKLRRDRARVNAVLGKIQSDER